MQVTERLGERTIGFRHEPGPAPTLVFLHGASMHGSVYDRLIDALPGWNRVALNFPGRIGSDGPLLDAVEPLADFVGDFVRSCVKGPYVLVGYSLGGAVAMEKALRENDERLVALVLIATGARLRVHPSIGAPYEEAYRSGGPLPALDRAAYEDDGRQGFRDEAERMRALIPVETATMDWRACNTFDRMKDVGRIRLPTLILGGTDDAHAPPKFLAFLGDQIAGSDLRFIEGARHMLVMERAGEIAPIVASFVSTL